MSGKRMCQSYEIIDSRRVGNTEVVLGYSPTEVSPYGLGLNIRHGHGATIVVRGR